MSDQDRDQIDSAEVHYGEVDEVDCDVVEGEETGGGVPGGWPPGAIADWLPTGDARTLEGVLRVLGHHRSISVLGVAGHQGPVTLARVCELAQLDASIARPRLLELSRVGLLIYHRRSGPQVATWELNHDAMIRLGAYFIRPRPLPPGTHDQPPVSPQTKRPVPDRRTKISRPHGV
ncbi:MAG: hypothetical protein M3Y49_05375 [Actinomycetota bacterium]|nr:hypothetical protein [Actinomycetota bacterium]